MKKELEHIAHEISVYRERYKGDMLISVPLTDEQWAIVQAKLQSLESVRSEGDDPVLQAILIGPDERFEVALNVKHPKCHAAANAFWEYWKANGETHKHGYYESTWGAINAALRLVGVRTHNYSAIALSPARVAEPFDLKKHLSKPEEIIEIDEDGNVELRK